MNRVVDGCRATLREITRLIPDRASILKRRNAPLILAVIPPGPCRNMVERIASEAGFTVSVSNDPSIAAASAIIIYDLDLSNRSWADDVMALTMRSPRPYLILLSPNTDINLWGELQRVGGSDLLRKPIDPERMIRAIKRGWMIWRSQQRTRA